MEDPCDHLEFMPKHGAMTQASGHGCGPKSLHDQVECSEPGGIQTGYKQNDSGFSRHG